MTGDDRATGQGPLHEYGSTVPPAPPIRVGQELADGDELLFGGGARVVHSPGRTPGSVGMRLPRHAILFTGDCVASVEQVMASSTSTARRPWRRSDGWRRCPGQAVALST